MTLNKLIFIVAIFSLYFISAVPAASYRNAITLSPPINTSLTGGNVTLTGNVTLVFAPNGLNNSTDYYYEITLYVNGASSTDRYAVEWHGRAPAGVNNPNPSLRVTRLVSPTIINGTLVSTTHVSIGTDTVANFGDPLQLDYSETNTTYVLLKVGLNYVLRAQLSFDSYLPDNTTNNSTTGSTTTGTTTTGATTTTGSTTSTTTGSTSNSTTASSTTAGSTSNSTTSSSEPSSAITQIKQYSTFLMVIIIFTLGLLL
ncbi:hypothetical protein PPL_04644 [Heterostelium album PN500]|uniref:Uncharacterized protein n=1 Tax=Heterostelium pallidum (strain ATCC 26659 / Pp 5 / PN500) TaxID=670386 RepID=D3B853_HETP5|nr:hypothetical protein PPL_04644 [Heterostelium album PN500]EFA82221.1 hypothetical protein PPL_04644 [Heterostelium album PN500]|eukprot:XP_020434338.1 hypothetical protein PPL_04644 [Heterostelium album PN500]